MKPADYGAAIQGPYEDGGGYAAELETVNALGTKMVLLLSEKELEDLHEEAGKVLEAIEERYQERRTAQDREDEQEARASW